MAKILIADDDKNITNLLSHLLDKEGHELTIVHNGEKAILKGYENNYDLFLIDIEMPQEDGITVCETLKNTNKTKDIPVLILTGYSHSKNKIKALKAGANDFLTKPIDTTELKLRVNNMLKLKEYSKSLENSNKNLQQEVDQKTKKLRETVNKLELAHEKIKIGYIDTIYRLSRALGYKDHTTGKHLIRLSRLSSFIAKNMSLPDKFVEKIYFASPMHDIGKISIPDHILSKPEALTEEEFEIVKSHTMIGYKLLKGSDSNILQTAAEIAISHHEQYNGTGYPNHCKGSEIPLSGRIVKLVDTYDSLRSERPYKDPLSHSKTMDKITSGDEKIEPKHFDPDILETLLKNEEAIEEIYNNIDQEQLNSFDHYFEKNFLDLPRTVIDKAKKTQ